VQHEREPLRRTQRFEHDKQSKPDRVGEQRIGLRIVSVADDRVWQMNP
jgi:hypothetical protein